MSKSRKVPVAEPTTATQRSAPLVALLTHPSSRWAIPLAVAVVALLIGVWTFDEKLSLSGDNTEFVTLARSMANGEGLTYTNLPEPRVATKYPFGFPLLLAPVYYLFGLDLVAMKIFCLMFFVFSIPLVFHLFKHPV